MSTPRSPLTGVLLAALLLGATVASARTLATAEAVADTGLESVPVPELSQLEPAVAQQLRAARAQADERLAQASLTAAQRASVYGSLGELYHAYELLDAALVCYRNARALDPREHAWPHLEAHVLRGQTRLDEAAARFATAVALQPTAFASLIGLAEVQMELGRDEEAEATFGKALGLRPDAPSALAGLGNLALRHRRFADAARYLNLALSAAPAANRLHYGLAMAYRGLGRVDEARQHLDKRGTVGVRAPDQLLDALEQLKGGERVHLVQGRVAFAAGQYAAAAREFQDAVEADPRSVRSLVNLGTALAQMGDLSGAAARYQEALALEPEHLTARFNLGNLLARSGNTEQAIVHLLKVVAAKPDDVEAQLLLARTFVAASDDNASLGHFEQAARLDPTGEGPVLEGAQALVRLQRYAQARPVLEAGLRRIPSSSRIAYALARLLAASPDGAVRDGARALDLAMRLHVADPSPRHAQVVAQAMAELGRCEQAAQWQQKVVDQAASEGAKDVLSTLRADVDMYRKSRPCRPPLREERAGPPSGAQPEG